MVQSDIVVELQHVRKEFGSALAVSDLCFQVREGEIVGLLGANGAGKTTSIHMLLGLITPTSGSIKMFGKDLERNRIEILEKTNFASAYQFLPWNLKVWENLFVFAEIYRVKQGRKRINDLLEMFELAHMRNRITGALSAGEQTRVNLCKALLNEPRLLLLDEPTASLDPDQADKVRKIISGLQKQTGMTVINTSHNMIDVHELCGRILFMQNGRVTAEGCADEIMRQYGSASLEEVFIRIARTPVLEKLEHELAKN